MLTYGNGELVVCLNESQHRIVVWRRVLCVHVGLNASAGATTAVCKLADELVVQKLHGRGGLNKLGE